MLEDYELLEREALALLEDRVLLPLDDADAYATVATACLDTTASLHTPCLQLVEFGRMAG